MSFEEETFCLGGATWDVKLAKELLEATPREPRFIIIDSLTPLLKLVSINRGHAAGVDLSEPIIFAPWASGLLLVDGWHRVYRALCLGLHELPALFLTAEEAEEVQ